jgi:putative addiction module killer protein
MPIRVEEYLREDGSNPYRRWFDGLDPQSAAKVTTAKLRLELGNTSSIKWFAGMGECVIDWGPGYRIYLAKDGDALIVLCGMERSAASNAISIRPRPCWQSTRRARRRR